MTINWKEDGKHFFWISVASLIVAVNLKTFVNTGGLFPGGMTGISVLIQRSAARYFSINIPYAPINLLLNLFPIYIGLKYLGRKLTLGAIYFIVLSSFLTDLVPSYTITYDPVLISIFGGMISGFASGLCLINNANGGGLDFISLYLSEKKGIDAFNITLGVNCVILTVAGLLFGWPHALYSIVYQYFVTQVIHLMFRRYQQTTLFIVTDHPAEVCEEIWKLSHHGATIMRGEGAYEHKERAVVYSVVSAAEYKKVMSAIRRIDSKAFVNSLRTEELRGWFYRRPAE